MILGARVCWTTVAATDAPASRGVPVVTSAPSPIISTSPSSTVAPGSPASFSTEITSSLATLYCLPPVRITANIMPADMVSRVPGATADTAADGVIRAASRAQMHDLGRKIQQKSSSGGPARPRQTTKTITNHSFVFEYAQHI